MADKHDETIRDEKLTNKDTAYSPGSDAETRVAQDDDPARAVRNDPDVPDDAVAVAPGTGDPDDTGDVEVDPGDLHGIPQFDKGH